MLPLGLITVLVVSACKKTEATTAFDCTGVTPIYTADIKSIFDASCALSGCHDAGTKEQGYDLSNYAGAKAASSKAALLGSIEHLSGYDAMPKGSGKLSDDKIKKISCWLDNGAPN